MGPCADPKDVTGGQLSNLNAVGAACLRTMEPFNSVGCFNFDGRTMTVNGMLTPCDGKKTTFAPPIGGYSYFEISAGKYAYAGFNWYQQ